MEEIKEKVYEKAVRLLSIRMHTTGELFQKLKRKGFKPADIRPVIARLEEQKFLDDARFAEIFVDNLKRHKDWGYYGIKAKLLARQIPSDMAAEALAEFYPLEDEIQVAARFLKKQKSPQNITWEKKAQALQRRGFRNDVIARVLKG